jgi:integrase
LVPRGRIELVTELRAEADRALAARLTRDKEAKAPVYVIEGARGKRQQAEAAATFTVENFRGHDLRRTAASAMASQGIARLTISKVLNHAERSVTAVYDRHSYDPEKAAALAWWDEKVKAILQQKPAKVRAFARRPALSDS